MQIDLRHPATFNPDGETLYCYPMYTDFRPYQQKQASDVPSTLPNTRKNRNRLSSIHFEHLSNELLPGDEDNPNALAAYDRVESRLFMSQPKSTGAAERPPRGAITCVSQKSSVRLRKLLSRVLGLDLWIDLTFADDVFEENGDLIAFPARMKRSYDCLNQFERVIRGLGLHYVWKKEIQTRKSGAHKGARIPHYHVCLCCLSDHQKKRWEALSISLLTQWVKITKTHHPRALTVALNIKNGVASSYRLIKDSFMAIRYVGKYFSKTSTVPGRDTDGLSDSIGRAWGYSKGVPLADPIVIHLHPSDAFKIRRIVKKFLKLKKNKRFIGLREQLERGYSTFCFLPDKLIKRLTASFVGEPLTELDVVPF
jgi:hypothetical protein